MATKKQIEELSQAIRKASIAALGFLEVPDDGTSNFDTLQIILSSVRTEASAGWTSSEIELAFSETGCRCYIQRSGKSLIVDVIGCTSGQGNRRTAMAEAARDSLRESGFDAYVYYQMD